MMGGWKRGWLRLRDFVGRFIGRGTACACPTRSHAACVGLIVVAGCFTLIIAPDDPSEPISLPEDRPTIVIDAGHGGNDDGAKSKGVIEKVVTLDLAERLETALRRRGFPTVQTRIDDRYVALEERVATANRQEGATLFVSLHFNQAGGKGINGIETFYATNKKLRPIQPKGWKWIGFFNPPESPDCGEYLAADVQSAVVAKTGARNRGIRARNLYVIRRTRGPAILIEGGFMSNTMEGYLLGSPDYMNRLAEGITDGIEAWWRMQPRKLSLPLAEGAKPAN